MDFSVMTEQLGDLDPVPVFSVMGSDKLHPKQLPCWITHTNARTRKGPRVAIAGKKKETK